MGTLIRVPKSLDPGQAGSFIKTLHGKASIYNVDKINWMQTLWALSFWPHGHNLNKLGPLADARVRRGKRHPFKEFRSIDFKC